MSLSKVGLIRNGWLLTYESNLQTKLPSVDFDDGMSRGLPVRRCRWICAEPATTSCAWHVPCSASVCVCCGRTPRRRRQLPPTARPPAAAAAAAEARTSWVVYGRARDPRDGRSTYRGAYVTSSRTRVVAPRHSVMTSRWTVFSSSSKRLVAICRYVLVVSYLRRRNRSYAMLAVRLCAHDKSKNWTDLER